MPTGWESICYAPILTIRLGFSSAVEPSVSYGGVWDIAAIPLGAGKRQLPSEPDIRNFVELLADKGWPIMCYHLT